MNQGDIYTQTIYYFSRYLFTITKPLVSGTLRELGFIRHPSPCPRPSPPLVYGSATGQLALILSPLSSVAEALNHAT